MKTLLTLACLLSTNAFANWQYTKWGMSIEQVAATAPQPVTPLSPEDQQKNSASASPNVALSETPYSSGQFQFRAIFSFDRTSMTLTKVELKLIGADQEKTNQLLGSLRLKYGEPLKERQGDIMSTASWFIGEDEIYFLSIGNDFASVSYSARSTKDNSGL